ncbi:MAG: hypothetical protein ACKPAD_11570, partial [Bacteroidota bacterium]
MPAFFPSPTDVLLGLAVLVVFFRLIYKLRRYFINRSVLFPRLDQEDLQAKFSVYLEKNSFYNSLDEVGKEKMLERCIHFASEKRFLGSKDFAVTGEMVVAISAT